MDVITRPSLISLDGLIRYLTANLEKGKKARFIDMPEDGMGMFCWPSLTFCMHDGALYQLYTIGGLVGYDPSIPEDVDQQKLWVKVKVI